jgi:hypothetical protein
MLHAADLAETLGVYRAEFRVRLGGIVFSSCRGTEAAKLCQPYAGGIVAYRDDLDDDCAVEFSRTLYRVLPVHPSLTGAARVAVRETVNANPAYRGPLETGLVLLDGAADG